MPHTFDELDFLAELARSTDSGIFVDVGASIGRFSQRFAELDWMIIAFEPEPNLAAEFRERVSGHSVTLLEKAVTNLDQESVDLYVSSQHWGIHSLAAFHPSHSTSLKVATTRLDSALRNTHYGSRPVILKIDIEGADFLALQSWDFSRSVPRVVMVEFMDGRSRPAFDYGHDDMTQFLKRHGYEVYASEWTPVESYAMRGIQQEGRPAFVGMFRTPIAHDPAWGNLIAVQEADIAWFEQHLVEYLTAVALESQELVSDAANSRERNRRLESSLQNRDNSLAAAQEGMRRREKRIAELDSAIIQRDRRIAELDSAIIQRDRRIAELDSAIIQRDRRIERLIGR